MRLSTPVAAIAAAILTIMFAVPASAEPAGHAVSPGTEATEAPSALAGPQDGDGDGDAAASQPEPVYPEGDPDITTLEGEDADAVAPSEPTVIVTIDKGIQEMTVWVDGVETYTWPVSTGQAGYSTPSGTYTASSMNKIWYSRQWDNAPMPHAIFFTKKGHAIHGTTEEKRLGNPASHGCVRLSRKNAATLFALVEEKGLKNTQVVLTGVTPGGEYKVSQPPPRPRAYPDYPGRGRYGWYDQYGYNDLPPPVQQQPRRRRFFFRSQPQPYYDSPPQQYQPQQRNRRWFRAPGY